VETVKIMVLFSDHDDDGYRASGYVCEKLVCGYEDGNAILYNRPNEHAYGADRHVYVYGCAEFLHVDVYGNGLPLPVEKHRLS
jgi:hypothetical protein